MTDIKKENTEIMIKMLNARALQEGKKKPTKHCVQLSEGQRMNEYDLSVV